MINIKRFHFNILETCCSVLWREGGHACVLVDPGMSDDKEAGELLSYLDANGLEPAAILLTHGHFDHTWGVPALLERRAVPVYMDPADDYVLRLGLHLLSKKGTPAPEAPFPTVAVRDGDVLSLAGLSFRVITTPGHSPGSVCYYLPDEQLLLSGDTLMAGSIGRSDFPGGDYDDLIRSLMDKVMGLPGEVEVIPGHGPRTTIGREAMTNPFLIPFNEPDEPDWEQDGLTFER